MPAGRRIPLRLWLVSGDALGERDGPTIGSHRNGVKEYFPSKTDPEIASLTKRKAPADGRGFRNSGMLSFDQ